MSILTENVIYDKLYQIQKLSEGEEFTYEKGQKETLDYIGICINCNRCICCIVNFNSVGYKTACEAEPVQKMYRNAQ